MPETVSFWLGGWVCMTVLVMATRQCSKTQALLAGAFWPFFLFALLFMELS